MWTRIGRIALALDLIGNDSLFLEEPIFSVAIHEKLPSRSIIAGMARMHSSIAIQDELRVKPSVAMPVNCTSVPVTSI